ncbi:Solute carrier family 17 member 9 [Schistosoma japonicum]|nr:Solute carrier family 17 member 9 [Schistosoma japonicum]KAH8863306.1 Solute carrier family 17 member 9 [Schistosoma japonicum]KAH8863307.1 Solute carrier family 17 member 9 [Schistosoma japonicum]
MWNQAERRKWVCLLFSGAVGLYASRAVMPIASVDIASEMNWNRKEMGFMMGVFFWGYAITQYLGGYLSDVFGGEIVIAISSLGWSVLTICFIWLPSLNFGSNNVYGLFVITRFLLGIFQGFYYPSLASLMANRVQVTDRNFTFAMINAGSHLGTILCGSLGSYLADIDGWRTPFFWIGILFLVWSFVVYLIITRQTKQLYRLDMLLPRLLTNSCVVNKSVLTTRGTKSGYCIEILDIEETVEPSESKFVCVGSKNMDTNSLSSVTLRPLNWSLLFKHKPFWVMLLANFVHNNTFYIILNWCPSYFHDNYPDARSWVFNMVPWLIIFPSVLLAGALADHWMKTGMSVTIVRKMVTTVVLVGSSVFLVILSSLDNYYESLVCMAFALACLGFHCSGVLLNPQDMAPEHGGQLYGIMATVGTFPGFAGVYMVGYILETTNQWSVIFILTAIISVVGWVGYVLYGSSEILF